MIYADDIGERCGGLQSFDPPRVAVRGMLAPVVERVAPELAILAKVIRRYAGDEVRPSVLVHAQDVAVRPGVGGVECDADRHVAEQGDAARLRMLVQAAPLPLEEVLQDLDAFDVHRALLCRSCERARLAVHVVRLPFHPRAFAVARLQDPEQGVVVQPGGVVQCHEALETGLRFGVGARGEPAGRELQELLLGRDQRAVVDRVPGQALERVQFVAAQQAGIDEVRDVDQHLVAGEGRQGLVRGVGVGGRPERQELPDAKPRVGQRVDETAGGRADLADAMPARQRRDVQAHAGLRLGRQDGCLRPARQHRESLQRR